MRLLRWATAILVAAACFVAGCAPTPLQLASVTANEAKAMAERAEVVDSVVCAEDYQAIAKLPVERRAAEVARVDPYCERLRVAKAGYETAWKALLAAVLAAELGATNAEALLVDRRADLLIARYALARAVAGSP